MGWVRGRGGQSSGKLQVCEEAALVALGNNPLQPRSLAASPGDQHLTTVGSDAQVQGQRRQAAAAAQQEGCGGGGGAAPQAAAGRGSVQAGRQGAPRRWDWEVEAGRCAVRPVLSRVWGHIVAAAGGGGAAHAHPPQLPH